MPKAAFGNAPSCTRLIQGDAPPVACARSGVSWHKTRPSPVASPASQRRIPVQTCALTTRSPTPKRAARKTPKRKTQPAHPPRQPCHSFPALRPRPARRLPKSSRVSPPCRLRRYRFRGSSREQRLILPHQAWHRRRCRQLPRCLANPLPPCNQDRRRATATSHPLPLPLRHWA